jgi:hypothetical protein
VLDVSERMTKKEIIKISKLITVLHSYKATTLNIPIIGDAK